MEPLTHNDLLDALQDLLQSSALADGAQDGLTTREMADKLRVSAGTIQNMLHRVAAEGRLETLRVVRISPLDGIRHRYTLYRLRP